MRSVVLALALVSLPVAASAQSTTIDFSSLGFDGPTNAGPRGVSSPLVIGNYTFTATDPFGLPPILVYSRQSTNNPDFGGTSILPNRSNTGITITRTDGGLFDFLGLDLTYAYDDQNAFFTGGVATFLFNGGASSQTRAFDALAGFQTFNFNATGISSVQITADSPFAIDNVRLNAVAAAVPEPATWAMMLVGFGAIGFSMRRRRSAQALRTAAI